jgi:hypothetical protein
VSTFETAYRLRYQLAPTDPRFLEATEEDMIRDALLMHFAHHQAEEERDPDRYRVQELMNEPEFAAMLTERRRNLTEDPEWLRRHDILAHGPDAAREQPMQNKTMTVRSIRVSPPRKP